MNTIITEVNGVVKPIQSRPAQLLLRSREQSVTMESGQDLGGEMPFNDGFHHTSDVLCDEIVVPEIREEGFLDDIEDEIFEQLYYHCELASNGVSRVTKLRALDILDPGRTRKGHDGKKRGRKPRAEVGHFFCVCVCVLLIGCLCFFL